MNASEIYIVVFADSPDETPQFIIGYNPLLGYFLNDSPLQCAIFNDLQAAQQWIKGFEGISGKVEGDDVEVMKKFLHPVIMEKYRSQLKNI